MCRGKSTEEKKRVNSVEKNTGERTKEKKEVGAVERRIKIEGSGENK